MAKRSEDFSLNVGGTPARGTLVTDTDTGVVQWYPKKTVFVTTLAGPIQTQSLSANYLESSYNTETEKWEWTPVNKEPDGSTVYTDIRSKSENPSVANQYTTDTSVAREVNENSLPALNQTIDANWKKYNVEQTAKRGKLGYAWIRNPNVEETGAAVAASILNNLPKTVTINPIGQGPTRGLGAGSYGNYVYPEALRENPNQQDVIKFTLKKIEPAEANLVFGNKTFTRQFKTIEGSVTLPIQPIISDSNVVDWSGLGLGPLGAYGAAAANQLATGSKSVGDIFTTGTGLLQESLKKMFTDSKSSNDYKNAISLYIAEQAVGIQGLLSRATGAVVNNNLELLFQGPQLRPFNFQFKMSPRSSTEAEQVRQIIRFFKQAMSVKDGKVNTFLQSPFVFDIRYLINGTNVDHPSINRIKTCALIGCDVDYTPDGSYMTFNDEKRTMTSYGINLRFSELEPVFESDYQKENLSVDDIGY